MSKLLLFLSLTTMLYAEDIYLQKKCISHSELINLIKANNISKLRKDIRHACNLSKQFSDDETLLFDAVRLNNLSAVKYLINYGMDINHTNSKGQNLLHIAMQHNFSKIVEVLLKKGLKDKKDNLGYDAKWYGYENNALESLETMKIYEKNKISNEETLDDFIKNFHKKPIDEM